MALSEIGKTRKGKLVEIYLSLDGVTGSFGIERDDETLGYIRFSPASQLFQAYLIIENLEPLVAQSPSLTQALSDATAVIGALGPR